MDTTDAGHRSHLAARVRTYRLASSAGRDILRSGARHDGRGSSRSRGHLDELAAVRAEATEALADVYAHDQDLAVLLAEEHCYLKSFKRHDDPRRLRYRRAVHAWLLPPVECTTCTGRVFEVAPGVWLTYRGYEARCPSRGTAPHVVAEWRQAQASDATGSVAVRLAEKIRAEAATAGRETS